MIQNQIFKFTWIPQRIPSPWSKEGEPLEQEYNVKYVIETRAKEALYFVKLENFTGDLSS
jgi:hypothetical protein